MRINALTPETNTQLIDTQHWWNECYWRFIDKIIQCAHVFFPIESNETTKHDEEEVEINGICVGACVCFQSEFTDKNLDVFHFSMGYFLVLCVHCFRAWDFFFVLNSFSFIPEKDRKMKYFTTAKKMKCTFSIWLHGICRAIFLTN